MVQIVRFVSEVSVLKGLDISPIPIGEANGVARDFVGEAIYKIQSNTQGHLRMTVNKGNLTAVHFKMYFLTREVSTNTYFVQTVSQFSGNVEQIDPVDRKITTSGTVSLDYAFSIPACDGIRIVFWGEGTDNTGSSITNLHLALRTN